MIRYILECIAFQLLFLTVYDLFLKKETFFQWNRAYLIGTYLLSLILPWVKLEVLKSAVPDGYAINASFFVQMEEVILTPKNTAGFQWEAIPWGQVILFGGMVLAAVLLGYKMLQLYRLRKKGRTHYFSDFIQIIVPNSEIAFSFFQSIFLGENVSEKEKPNIVQHELVHIKQRHSWDLMFFELMRIISWFDPMVYIYQNRISELHEFIADAHVTKTNKKEQYQLLLSQVFQTQNISFINQFHKSSLIKKRIVMLTKERSKRILKLKYLLLIPVVMAMLVYSSCQQGKVDKENLTPSELSGYTGVDVPFAVVEEPPVFPGCENASDKRACFNEMMQKHISDNFQYPEEAQKKEIQGRVAIMFTIDEEGNITNIQKRGPDKLLEDEAVRIISKLPKMTPGKQKGHAVGVPFSIPITFKLQGDSAERKDGLNSSKRVLNGMTVLAYLKNEGGNSYLSGMVTDGAGLGIPGVNIIIKESNKGTVTDFDGRFRIKAQKGDAVAFQYIGLPTAILNVADQEKYRIVKTK